MYTPCPDYATLTMVIYRHLNRKSSRELVILARRIRQAVERGEKCIN